MPDTTHSPQITLQKTRIRGGVWEGMLVAEAMGAYTPQIEVTHLGAPVEGVEVVADGEMDKVWTVRVPIPAKLLSEGVQTFVISDGKTSTTLDTFTIVTGEPLEDDIRAEVDLLRAELDMLKKAFRRHCLEVLGH
ncbi:hypothetical protein [Vannielia sp.]|uniref:hypothetical protein n=1 Tax=Vannielia sp. TaxID=2813045 RepID=UPI002632FCFA|nr:hypothetical protein [Vannielia sp.]MDF1873583.1 hypothetical protein [Vannielia sp.]